MDNTELVVFVGMTVFLWIVLVFAGYERWRRSQYRARKPKPHASGVLGIGPDDGMCCSDCTGFLTIPVGVSFTIASPTGGDGCNRCVRHGGECEPVMRKTQ